MTMTRTQSKPQMRAKRVTVDITAADHTVMWAQSLYGGRSSPAVACWASDHWVASSNPLGGKFRH